MSIYVSELIILTEVKKHQCREKLMVNCLTGSVLWVGTGEVPGRKPGPQPPIMTSIDCSPLP